jgi:hypothetical protein
MLPTTIKEEGNRWTIDNARPRNMRVVIGVAAPIVLGFLAISIMRDLEGHDWLMLTLRLLFAAVVVLGTVFSLFGAESLVVESGELVWRRGSSQERRCKLGEIARIERMGNHLRVYARGDDKHPSIVIGAGLRQQPAAIEWLRERVDAAITAAKTGR